MSFLAALPLMAQELPENRWVELHRDPLGARRGSAIRYAENSGSFLLWGFMTPTMDHLQEHPMMEVPEYDVAAFDPAARRWTNHLPPGMDREWSRRLPLAYVPRTYSALTTGSERTVMRGSTDDEPGVPRPDLNIVFDQVAYRPADGSLYYFTGGLTARYDVARRRWHDLRPTSSPPPVLGGSLAYDPLHDELVLSGGGHVAERTGNGPPRGYTGTWVYRVKENTWAELLLPAQPPPRMVTRLVTDTSNHLLVLFGGDGQRHYLADTWIFDLKSRAWRQSKAAGPEPRAGHFTVYDPVSGKVLIGGGYNRKDLTDMWAYDAAADQWSRLDGEVPTGFYLSADIAPEKRLLVLVTSTRTPGDRAGCNVIFPVRTTYGYRLGEIRQGPVAAVEHPPMPKYASESSPPGKPRSSIPENQWVLLDNPGRAAPTRTWGSATFDSKRSRILYWGGGHCGYEGSDVDYYDVAAHTWIPEPHPPSYPERLWNHASSLAGLTFDGEPWTDHGRRIYSYDPAGDRMVMVVPVRLTTGYEPAWLRNYPARTAAAPDSIVQTPSSYTRFVTFTYSMAERKWVVLGPAPLGLDTLVTTPLGVMGVPVNWRARLNAAGYQLPFDARQQEDNAVYLLRGTSWERLSAPGPSPQYLYEMTSLAFDTRRNQLILHGAGTARNELWTFDVKSRRWVNRKPQGEAPTCMREAVYLAGRDVFLTYGPGLWEYSPAANTWRKTAIGDPPVRVGQNRAMVYDSVRDWILLVLGQGGDQGRASVYALRYSPE
ncbi:MAG: hypothetical protein JNL98_09175 [Bryobacterales bacterium]|nr:hypothetical protein [Bryobacterales bacterium]